MDIKERLRLIDSLRHSNKVIDNEKPEQLKTISEGQVNNNSPSEGYDCFDFSYEPGYRQGDIRINDYFSKNSSSVKLFLKEYPSSEISLKKTLFLDTETTGLSGGVGTCAFLVGVAYLNQDGHFTLRQFFMNDFDEEHAMLTDISNFAKQFDLLVTYNGKSYDIPLLNSRFIFNGIPTPFSEINHLDILHSVRRLWNHRLPDCSLLSAEKYIVRKTREGDIPGFMIPYIFFEYLKSKDKEPLKPVFYHNREDILTMVAIINEMVDVVENPIAKRLDSQGILRVGRFYENRGRYDLAIPIYNNFLEASNDDRFKKEIRIQLAFAYKKQNNWNLAQSTWLEIIENDTFHPLPFIELAKHLEHREKDHGAARKLVGKALKEMEIVYALGRNAHWQEYREDLIYRFNRLQNKMKNT